MRFHFAHVAPIVVAVVFAASAAVSAQDAASQPGAPAPVSFKNEIAPILLKRCVACHGERQPKSGYQLHTIELLQKAGDFAAPPIVAGKPDESQLFLLLSSEDAESWMPKEDDKLPAEQIALVKRWIEEGAKFDVEDPKATLASVAPRQYAPAPKAYPGSLPITALAYNPQGDELVAGGYNEITIWNAADGALKRRIKDAAQRTYALAYNADGTLLAAASGVPGESGEVKLFNPATGEAVKLLGTMSDVALDVKFSPDGAKLAACSADRSIRVYDVASGAQDLLIEDHADWVAAIAWNADGSKLASASRDKTSKVFDAKTGESQITYNGHGQSVNGVAFSPDGAQLITSGGDNKLHVWNPADAAKIAEIAGYGGEVFRVLVANGQIWSCSADKTARQHDAAGRNEVRNYAGHADHVFAVAVHPASNRLAAGAFNGEVTIWNTADGAQVVKFFALPGYKP